VKTRRTAGGDGWCGERTAGHLVAEDVVDVPRSGGDGAATRRAGLEVASTAVLAVLIAARIRQSVALQLNSVGQLDVLLRGEVGLDGQPGAAVVEADAEHAGREVAEVVTGRSPSARFLDRVAGRVDVVLSGGALTLPLPRALIGAGELLDGAWLSIGFLSAHDLNTVPYCALLNIDHDVPIG